VTATGAIPRPAAGAEVGRLLRDATGVLAAAGIPTARQDAELLVAAVLGAERLALHLAPGRPVDPGRAAHLAALVDRRARWEPLQYVLGRADFAGLTLAVGPGVFIPRPETEELAARALAVLPPVGGVVLEPCTGSGAVAAALAARRPGLRVAATERSPDALAWARRNLATLGLDGRVALLAGDLLAPLAGAGLAGRCDLLVANPPYLAREVLPGLPAEVRAWEPVEALDGGPDGLEVIARLLDDAPAWLRPGGTLLLEIGDDQGDRLRRRLGGDGRYGAFRIHRDLAGRERVLEARRA
jgi:release factor glutamine methyltransferase